MTKAYRKGYGADPALHDDLLEWNEQVECIGYLLDKL